MVINKRAVQKADGPKRLAWRIAGSPAKARATATHCYSPPESCARKCFGRRPR